jgi:hypothetical protein
VVNIPPRISASVVPTRPFAKFIMQNPPGSRVRLRSMLKPRQEAIGLIALSANWGGFETRWGANSLEPAHSQPSRQHNDLMSPNSHSLSDTCASFATTRRRRLIHAAIFGTTLSTNRRNRGLRAPATKLLRDIKDLRKGPGARAGAFRFGATQGQHSAVCGAAGLARGGTHSPARVPVGRFSLPSPATPATTHDDSTLLIKEVNKLVVTLDRHHARAYAMVIVTFSPGSGPLRAGILR